MLQESRDGCVSVDGILYKIAGDKVYSCAQSADSDALFHHTGGDGFSENEILAAALRGSVDSRKLEACGLRDKEARYVILFRTGQAIDPRSIRDMIPIEDTDRIALMNRGDAAILMQLRGRSKEEIVEYANAVADTLESEAGVTCFAGIGRPAENFRGLPAAYREAATALETGIRHNAAGRVFDYCRQTMERLADAIPKAEAEKFRREIFSPQAEKVLTAEMMETIRTYFRNDLNLSTTARQLFIHRNTLLYRMEKIRKATGLDLRGFGDAAAFQIILNLTDRQNQGPENQKEGNDA